MNKKHWLYVGGGVALLLLIYFFLSCDCKEKGFTAKFVKTEPNRVVDLEHDKGEI